MLDPRLDSEDELLPGPEFLPLKAEAQVNTVLKIIQIHSKKIKKRLNFSIVVSFFDQVFCTFYSYIIFKRGKNLKKWGKNGNNFFI